MSSPLERLRRSQRVGCPFCFEWIPAFRLVEQVYSAGGCLGGRCVCGAVFVVDETGRSGGLALMDAQVLLCDGDLSEASTLESGVHVDVETREYHGLSNTLRRAHSPLTPKVWFVKRRA